MNNTYDFKKLNTFKVSKRSKLYNLVIFCCTLDCSCRNNSEFSKEELDYINYYESFKTLDNEGLYYFYQLFGKLIFSNIAILSKKLGDFFYSSKACNIDNETLLYCAILLNNFGYDFTDFLEKWNICYFSGNNCYFN